MLDGASRITRGPDGSSKHATMFDRAAELGQPAIALTDHGVMYGAIPFYLEGRAKGIKPLIGMEAYVAPRSRFDRPAQREDWYFHLTMIAASNQGYSNLMKLSSLGFLEGYDSRSRRPRLDKEILGQYHEGLVVLSGCLSSELAKAVVGGRKDEARRIAAEYREIFGDRYFLEMQNHGIADQHLLNDEIAAIGRELSIPLVATNDSHYTMKEDAEAHDILLCIQMGKEVSDQKRLKFDTDEFYLKSRDEMLALFPNHGDAIENTLMVAEMVAVDLELHNMILPVYEVPAGETLASYLEKLTFAGLRRRYDPISSEVESRARMELRVIEEMGYSGYFLIVSDFVGWAKSNRIRVGPGRGSVGGSIVAYALGITELDPLRWRLPFERFLNPGRKSMPDIDIDFDERRRNEVIRYVSEKYGEDHVAQIITFSTIKAKAAIRDAARVLGFPYAVGDRLAKIYPPLFQGKEAPFEACFEKSAEWPPDSGRNDAYANGAELRRAYEEDEISRQVIDTARKLEGLRRQHSVHAAGVVIGREPLINHVPVQRTDGEIVTQYEMGAVEQIGLLKMDFLGLRNLTVIGDSIDHIRRTRGTEIDIDSLPLDDPKTYKLLQDGHSMGVFQMESGGMTRLLRQLRPDRFEEIAALIALYRPGPMDEIPRYVKGKHDQSSVTYFHALLEKVLEDTNGVIVYQEQVTEMLQLVAGFSPQEADMVRYAIGKKKSKELIKWKGQFEEGSKRSGLTDQETEGLWELIKPFAGYSFNRAHANGYALIAYQTAWLKANYPVEYMAAVLTSIKDKIERIPGYLAECRALGIRVLPPNVNESELDFTPRKGEILFGLSAIRNVGESVAEKIIAERESRGGYAAFHEFVKRVDPSCLNKKVMESLSKAGAFDALGMSRTSLLMVDVKGEGSLCLSEQVQVLVEGIVSERKSEDAGQFSLFQGVQKAEEAHATNGYSAHLVPGDLPDSVILAAEKEMLGFYVSHHPLEAVEPALRYQSEAEIGELAQEPDGKILTVGGILGSMVRKFTKKGELWYTGTLEDMKASVEVIFWPKTVQECPPDVLSDDSIVLIKGRVEVRDENVKLVAQKVSRPDLSGAATPLRIRLPAASCTPDRLEELKLVLSSHPGPSPVLLLLVGNKKSTVLKLGGSTVELRNGLFAELKSLLGAEALA